MRLSTAAVLFSSSLLSLTSAATTAATTTSSTSTAPAQCTTLYYPGTVTNTKNQNGPFYVQVDSQNPAIDGKNVQLRPKPNTPGTMVVAVDNADSPVLALQMRKGTLYSQARDFSNNIHDLGPVGGLVNVTYNAKTDAGKMSFLFRNTTGASTMFMDSQAGWQLLGGGNSAMYNLYHREPLETSNGFIACNVTDSRGPFYQLFYTTSTRTTPNYPNCDFIALQVTLAPARRN